MEAGAVNIDSAKGVLVLTGKKFKLNRATLGLDIVNGHRRAISIPVGSIIKVLSGPTQGDRMVDVLWDGKTLEMFAVDVDVRGTEINDPERPDQSATA